MKAWAGLLVLGLFWASATWAGQPERTRPPAVAGSWYPGDAGQLTGYVDGLLEGTSKALPGTPRALIAPHAGYVFSGAAAADGYRPLRGLSFERVLVLGPAHRGNFRGLSIAEVTHYETPLGTIPLDREAVLALRKSPLVHADPIAHEQEHSIEMQLPLLQRSLKPGWKLLPVLVGDMRAEDYAAAAQLLRPLVDGQTLVVVSSDFTHYGPRYAYLPFPHDRRTGERIKALDQGALNHILGRDAEALLRYQAETGITICGYRPIALLLHLLDEAAQGQVLSRTDSAALTGDYRHSVSYLSILFTIPPSNPRSGLTPDPLKHLHRIAAAAVEAAAKPRDPAPLNRLERLVEALPAALQAPSGVFVTLRREGRVRGCIGHLQPDKPLYQAVAENGVNAAVRDVRFSPLDGEELAGLEVEVSVLTPPGPVDSYRDFDLGEEGIILEKKGRIAVYLPDVALEQGWNRDQTLTQLSLKAGLAPDAWRRGARFKTFRAIKYAAPWSAATQ